MAQLCKPVKFGKSEELEQYWTDSGDRLEVCQGELREIFDIPRNAKTIWIGVEDKPSKWTCQVSDINVRDTLARVDDNDTEFMYTVLIYLRELTKDRESVYVRVWYLG